MGQACYMISVGDGAWRVARRRGGDCDFEDVLFGADDTLDDRADAVVQRLTLLGYTREPIVLALPSAWCLSATISADGLERSGRRRAMLFRLEEQLPVAAEQVVADYVDHGNGEAVGVCVEIDRVKPIVVALESRGVSVRHVCPVVLLAAAHVLARQPDTAGVVIAQRRDTDATSQTTYDLIETSGERLARWWWFADDLASLIDQLTSRALADDRTEPMSVMTLDWTNPQLDTRPDRISLRESPMTGDEAAMSSAGDMLEGVASPWIDFRRDALAAANRYEVYRTPLRALVAGVMVLLLGVSAATYWRGRQYEALAGQYVSQQADVFRATMPGQRLPGSIKARMLSEKQKLAGLGGHGSDREAAQWLASPSALSHLGVVLHGLPPQLRFRISDLHVQPDLIRIDGQARSHADADQIAAAVLATGLLHVDSPRTQSLRGGGVSFLLTAKPRHAAATAGEALP